MSNFNSTDDVINSTYLEAFRGAQDENHFTLGGGFRFSRYEVGLAGDFGDNGTVIVANVSFQLGNLAAITRGQ